MPYQFRQTGAEIQDILDQVGENTTDISSINTTLTNINVLKGSSTSGSVSPASGTWTQTGTATLPAGDYLIIAGAMWNPNANGVRGVGISLDGNTPSGRYNIVTTAPVSGEYIYNQIVKYVSLAAQTGISVWVRQTSGGSLSCNPYFYAIRLR